MKDVRCRDIECAITVAADDQRRRDGMRGRDVVQPRPFHHLRGNGLVERVVALLVAGNIKKQNAWHITWFVHQERHDLVYFLQVAGKDQQFIPPVEWPPIWNVPMPSAVTKAWSRARAGRILGSRNAKTNWLSFALG